MKNYVLESARVVEFYHVLMNEKLESKKISDSVKDSVKILNQTKCVFHKLELPIFNGNPVEWQGFRDHFSLSINRQEGLCDIDRFNCIKKYVWRSIGYYFWTFTQFRKL